MFLLEIADSSKWDLMRTQTVFVSATPGPWELEQTKGKFIDQVIRPTGLIDPPVEIRPAKNQVDDLMHECKKVIENNQEPPSLFDIILTPDIYVPVIGMIILVITGFIIKKKFYK